MVENFLFLFFPQNNLLECMPYMVKTEFDAQDIYPIDSNVIKSTERDSFFFYFIHFSEQSPQRTFYQVELFKVPEISYHSQYSVQLKEKNRQRNEGLFHLHQNLSHSIQEFLSSLKDTALRKSRKKSSKRQKSFNTVI